MSAASQDAHRLSRDSRHERSGRALAATGRTDVDPRFDEALRGLGNGGEEVVARASLDLVDGRAVFAPGSIADPGDVGHDDGDHAAALADVGGSLPRPQNHDDLEERVGHRDPVTDGGGGAGEDATGRDEELLALVE